MTRFKSIVSIAILGILILACKKQNPQLGEAPELSDADFQVSPTAANPNIVEFTANEGVFQFVWDLGNGQTGKGTKITGVYPNAGVYSVKLTVFGSGGSISMTKEINIAQTDPSLLDSPLYNALTGGASGQGWKTWAIDSLSAGHFGVGPDPVSAAGEFPEWYSAQPLDKAGVGLYDDRYTFYLNNFRFDMITNGTSYVHNTIASNFPGSYENAGDFTAPINDQIDETWVVTEGNDTTISISGSSFLGMYTGVNIYKVLSYSDTSLWLSYKHHEGGLTWYLKLIPEGFVSSGGGPSNPTFSLPIDCETVEPSFTTFGNSTASVINNPDASGINTSLKVIETVHGDQTWSGFYVDLSSKLDFTASGIITLKVWAPTVGDFRLKLENSDNPLNEFLELDVAVTTANSWELLTFDFGQLGAASDVYDRIVMFPGWNIANAGTFYVDEINQP
jgi:PKD repeat protein